MSGRRRNHFPGGLPLPVLRQAGQRVPRQGLLWIQKQTRRIVARLPDRGVRELGRLSEQEQRGLQGDSLILGPGGRFVNGSEWGHGLWRGGRFLEDWIGTGIAPLTMGAYSWSTTALGAGFTLSKPLAAALPVAWGEAGILRIETAGASGDGGIVGTNPTAAAPLHGNVRPGTWCSVKARLPGTVTNLTAWAGTVSALGAAGVPDAGLVNAVSVIGFVARPGGSAGNWFGICRTGVNETVLDLGVAANGTWRMLSWEAVSTTEIRFWRDDGAGAMVPIGSITSNIPVLRAIPAQGIQTHTNAVKQLDVDLIGLQWTSRRI